MKLVYVALLHTLHVFSFFPIMIKNYGDMYQTHAGN